MPPPKKKSSKLGTTTKTEAAKPAVATEIKAAAAPVVVVSVAPPPPMLQSPAAAAVQAITVTPALRGPEAIAAYQELYDTLGRAYWEASDLHSKDTIQGARDAIYNILTDLNIAKLKANTAAYEALLPKVDHANKTLEGIKDDIGTITKNITTAANVITAVTRVLKIVAMV
jgi:hypothetical protein